MRYETGDMRQESVGAKHRRDIEQPLGLAVRRYKAPPRHSNFQRALRLLENLVRPGGIEPPRVAPQHP